jgi:hypothetical protein
MTNGYSSCWAVMLPHRKRFGLGSRNVSGSERTAGMMFRSRKHGNGLKLLKKNLGAMIKNVETSKLCVVHRADMKFRLSVATVLKEKLCHDPPRD